MNSRGKLLLDLSAKNKTVETPEKITKPNEPSQSINILPKGKSNMDIAKEKCENFLSNLKTPKEIREEIMKNEMMRKSSSQKKSRKCLFTGKPHINAEIYKIF